MLFQVMSLDNKHNDGIKLVVSVHNPQKIPRIALSKDLYKFRLVMLSAEV